jgi:hypothetical protein
MTAAGASARARAAGRLTPRAKAWAERINRYADLRREGVSAADAAAGVGISRYHDGLRYERWYQAAERGETELPRPAGAA